MAARTVNYTCARCGLPGQAEYDTALPLPPAGTPIYHRLCEDMVAAEATAVPRTVWRAEVIVTRNRPGHDPEEAVRVVAESEGDTFAATVAAISAKLDATWLRVQQHASIVDADLPAAPAESIPLVPAYSCPQCGSPDPRGEERHAWYEHTFDGMRGETFPGDLPSQAPRATGLILP